MVPHIAIFIPSLAGGGAEHIMVMLANRFAKEGVTVDLILAQKQGPYLEDVSRDVRVVDLKAKRVLFTLIPLISYLRREKPNVLVSSLVHTSIVAFVAHFLSFSRAKIVIRAANTLSWSLQQHSFWKNWVWMWGIRIAYRFADKIIAISQG